ncbi:hypothetical protein [Microlunatus sp. GCM10028923]|uniref:hypothetical protein n=1 Tax=Microlunatus sp. GCM10028923 TaxID=3273400 RepID=UPI00360AA407
MINTLVAEPDPPVAAGPFRAQLRFLINAGSVSAGVIAELADLRHDQLRPLLGRGSGADLIPAAVGRRLLSVTAAEVRSVRYELVPAEPVRQGLDRLLAAGWDLDRLTRYLRMRRPALRLLLDGRSLACSRLTQLRVLAALRTLPRRAVPPAVRSLRPVA